MTRTNLFILLAIIALVLAIDFANRLGETAECYNSIRHSFFRVGDTI